MCVFGFFGGVFYFGSKMMEKDDKKIFKKNLKKLKKIDFILNKKKLF